MRRNRESRNLSRLRWLILILGPLPIIGSSWAVSTWFRPEPGAEAVRNDVVHAPLRHWLAGFESRALASEVDDAAMGDAAASQAEMERACRQTAERLRKQIGPDCPIVVRSPFVISGDSTAAELESWYSGAIRPAMRAMQRSYFRTTPTQPITMLLFRNEASYNRYAQQLFNESGISIYGYYKPNVRTLLLNLGTGTGTLLHELTHALIDFDYPDAPDWLNEGLASLHEQCRFRGGERDPWLEGLANWRLKGLQEVIRKGRLRSLTSLVGSTDFRGPLEGTNYAQARYFCLYLQQKDLLASLYRALRDGETKATSARDAIAGLFPTMTWREIDQDFQRWVLELEAPR